MQLSLRQLSYFVAAAEAGGVTAAARALNVSQPSVSAALAALEERFGVALAVRHHAQGISLTPAGRSLLADARALLAHAREVEARAAGLGGDLAGTLDIGCFITFAPVFLPRLMRAFHERHPQIAVQPHEGHHEALQQGLLTGAYELALLYDLALGPQIEAEALADLGPYALVPPNHPLARQPDVSLAELAAEPMVLLDLPLSRDYFLSLFRGQGLEPRIAYRTPAYEMLRGLVANGHGCSVLNLRPNPDRTAYDGTRVVGLPIRDPLPPLRLVLARAAALRPTRKAEAFAALAREIVPAAVAKVAVRPVS